MKLIGSLASPYVRKVRVVLAEKNLDYQFELENVWATDLLINTLNPLGKVPFPMMEESSAIIDSRVMAEYLDTLTPVCKLLPPNGRDRADIRCWEALADGVLDAAILVRLERTQRAPELQSEAWVERQMRKVHLSLKAMSEQLGESAYCTGIHYSLGDVAVGCALGWLLFRFPEISWRDDYANLARLYDKLSERPSFKDTAPQ